MHSLGVQGYTGDMQGLACLVGSRKGLFRPAKKPVLHCKSWLFTSHFMPFCHAIYVLLRNVSAPGEWKYVWNRSVDGAFRLFHSCFAKMCCNDFLFILCIFIRLCSYKNLLRHKSGYGLKPAVKTPCCAPTRVVLTLYFQNITLFLALVWQYSAINS